MKRFLKICISFLLAITIVFSSSYVGLNELDFNGLFEVKAVAASESDLTFTLNDDGASYSVTDCNDFVSGELIIPELYNSLPVTNIGKYAFKDCTNLTSITISDNVISIGFDPFLNCTSLIVINVSENNRSYASVEGVLFNKNKKVIMKYPINKDGISYIIPDSVTSIGWGAFMGCTSLSSITIPNSVTSIGGSAFVECSGLVSIKIPDSVISIGNYAFQKCVGLTTLIIPDSVTNIGLDTFYRCENLVSAIIGNQVTSIGAYVFEKCINLTSVVIGDNVESIDYFAFSGCQSLASICVNESNSAYSSVDGALLTKDGTGLIICPEGKIQYTIPDGVTSIGYAAFYKRMNLCSITIPKSVTNIEPYAFDNCNSLRYVFYTGSESDWSDITISNGNIPITNTAVHYNATDHSYQFEIDKESTCIEDGLKHSECRVCGYCSESELIPAIGHTESGWIVDEDSNCIKDGSMHQECTVCGTVLETGTIAKKNHISGSWIIDEEATVYSAGKKVKKCTECGATLKIATIKQLKCSKPVLKKVYNANDYVKVTWGTVKGADLYRVYRKTGTGEYEYIGSTTHTYFNDKEAGAGKTCRYIVKAKNEAGYSEYSASLAVKHIDEPTLKSIENSAHGVLLKWGKVTGAEKYNVYRKTSGGEYEYIGATSKTYYTDKTAKSGTKYYYAIRAKRDDSISSQSASLSKLYLADPTLKTPSSTKSGITLKWSKVTGAEGYMVYRKTADGSYKRITTEEGISNVTFRDTTAEKGNEYTYKIKAYYSKTYSAYSNEKAVTDKY